MITIVCVVVAMGLIIAIIIALIMAIIAITNIKKARIHYMQQIKEQTTNTIMELVNAGKLQPGEYTFHWREDKEAK